jgi:hypothetical protein
LLLSRFNPFFDRGNSVQLSPADNYSRLSIAEVFVSIDCSSRDAEIAHQLLAVGRAFDPRRAHQLRHIQKALNQLAPKNRAFDQKLVIEIIA